jgi:hypothetical protein
MFPVQNIQTTHRIRSVVGGLLEEKIFNHILLSVHRDKHLNHYRHVFLFYFIKIISTRDGQMNSAEDENGQIA